MKLLLVALLGCASAPPRLDLVDLRAYCAIHAYRVGNGVSWDTLQRVSRAQGVIVSRRDSTLRCSTIHVGF